LDELMSWMTSVASRILWLDDELRETSGGAGSGREFRQLADPFAGPSAASRPLLSFCFLLMRQ
jgi:hypothetical protein